MNLPATFAFEENNFGSILRPKGFTFPLELNLSIDKNRSTLSVGGFFESDAPKVICSEPHPSLFLGENTVRRSYLLKNLSRKNKNRQGTLALPYAYCNALVLGKVKPLGDKIIKFFIFKS